MTNELAELRKEVEKLKKQKKEKMALATTTEERDKLLIEINQLEAIKKSPSALKRFGNTYLRGLKVTGQTLWRGIKRASRNLETNAPELRQISKGMTGRPTMKPFSPMAEMYMPKPKVPKTRISKKKKGKKIKRTPIKKMKPAMMGWDLP